jgi:hypothetical protein
MQYVRMKGAAVRKSNTCKMQNMNEHIDCLYLSRVPTDGIDGPPCQRKLLSKEEDEVQDHSGLTC